MKVKDDGGLGMFIELDNNRWVIRHFMMITNIFRD